MAWPAEHAGRGAPRAVVLVASASRHAGGLYTSVRRLWGELAGRGWVVDVHSLRDAASDEDRPGWGALSVHYHRRVGPGRFGYSPTLVSGVRASVREGRRAGGRVLVDSHGLWMFSDLAGYRAQRELQVARVAHPHGMLEPGALRHSRAAKAVARLLWQASSLREATALRATSVREEASIRAAGYQGTVFVIPNGIDVPAQDAERPEPASESSVRRLVFLGRIHPIKGLPLLLRAWGRLADRFPEWRLGIAGPDQLGHREELRALAGQLGVERRCDFVGAVHGPAKESLLRQAELLVLPSYSESFGLVVAEALAAGIPVVTTTGTPWRRVEEKGCGWWVEPEVAALTAALGTALSQPASSLRAMGRRGRAWMAAEFSWSAIAAVADGAFRGVLADPPGGGRRPPG
jgi:glycosyltransferase involved in cell wall biosynthesis